MGVRGGSKREHLLPLDFAHILTIHGADERYLMGRSSRPLRWHMSCLEPLQLCVGLYKH